MQFCWNGIKINEKVKPKENYVMLLCIPYIVSTENTRMSKLYWCIQLFSWRTMVVGAFHQAKIIVDDCMWRMVN